MFDDACSIDCVLIVRVV